MRRLPHRTPPNAVNREHYAQNQVLKGLDHIHGRSVVHRDIKPENILLTYDGIVKICDFGVSRMFCSCRSMDLSAGMGTLWYQAPEVLMGLNDYDHTVDIWSVGTYGIRKAFGVHANPPVRIGHANESRSRKSVCGDTLISVSVFLVVLFSLFCSNSFSMYTLSFIFNIDEFYSRRPYEICFHF